MKGSLHPKNNVTINPSGNESIRDVIERMGMSRRRFIFTAASASALTVIGEVSIGGFLRSVEAAPIPPSPGFGGIGFESISPNLNNPATGLLEKDLVSVPPGYKVEVLVAWGDPIMRGGQPWVADASQDAAAQEKQFGMHADGMHYFPLQQQRFFGQRRASNRGILCVNHEYTHEEILHSDGLVFIPATETAPQFGLPGSQVTIEKVRKSQAAHGVSIVEIFKTGKTWKVNRNSPYGRRITGNTEMLVSGPAAGDALLRSKKFFIAPDGSIETGVVNNGYTAYGTLNNCAHGYTPWGTYLTCEENWNGYFANPDEDVVSIPGIEKSDILAGQKRYGISKTGFGYRWHEVDPRFNASTNPLEPHLFGWVVEIDPYDPQSKPVKRTALGRFKHESAQVVVDDNNYVAFYMGDDERNEYIYKFVCARPLNRFNRAANSDMLDHGVLYVAKFKDDGTGEWLPLVYGQGGLIPENGFRSQAEVLVKTRQAADRVGATMMDRPEWTAVRPRVGGFQEIEVYCTLTNNNRRGTTPPSSNEPDGTTSAGSARPPVDAANPRPDNRYGHIIRWREDGRSVTATTFTWDLFVECGDKLDPDPNHVGNINGDDFGAPDGLWFDDFGRLWIQTDQAGNGLGDWKNIGGNVMMCADPNTKQIRRFLTSPMNCEVTGVITTPDGKTMFVNIQHPGEDAVASNPIQFSNWPHSQGYGPSGRPRSSTVVITREDGGIIGGL
ncbi:twin-arginine translocation pathway signal protein [Fischerella thermalis CCMEE 5330]|uniref:Twin-arginine translocation pathway signal protein n=1 Tax=Fischerella thermalis CCMEE 5330 TaxID=2019670 RepID=A0A2N6M884_9CYAN|nr:PhoX family phosphatase [Fischerella thermalis]PMB42994.1 twin-arginine translocation pathway signal protein [Fischerella thermalis CCMEE 5330]